jgi:hypothetical protein
VGLQVASAAREFLTVTNLVPSELLRKSFAHGDQLRRALRVPVTLGVAPPDTNPVSYVRISFSDINRVLAGLARVVGMITVHPRAARAGEAGPER